jgi:hypothetical protein
LLLSGLAMMSQKVSKIWDLILMALDL